jgi:pyridoxal 5'-phosphate synthase pdxT subunit
MVAAAREAQAAAHAVAETLLKEHTELLPVRIGVLAIQGDFAAHAGVLRELGAEVSLVRAPDELAVLDGLVLPGGETTTLLKFLERPGFMDALRRFVETKPAFGTCAGCILLASEVVHPAQKSLGVLDVRVERNAYGRQVDSVILSGETKLPGGPLEMVYIRAPRILRAGEDVEVLAERNGFPVLVRQGRLLAATFHPELSADRRVHQLFLDLVRAEKLGASRRIPEPPASPPPPR